MKPITIRKITLGTGIPKICVPIVGKTEDEIIQAAYALKDSPVEIVEWRADWFAAGKNAAAVNTILFRLRNIIGERPLLFTFRTAAEGGGQAIETDDYVALNTQVIESGLADLIDVELFLGETVVKALINSAHDHGCCVIASNHDFEKTPEASEMLKRLEQMAAYGADIAKLAVMPVRQEDVLALLAVTLKASQALDCPVITMSMSGMGAVSRIAGALTGSVMTFGAVGSASAPGQIPAQELKSILNLLNF